MNHGFTQMNTDMKIRNILSEAFFKGIPIFEIRKVSNHL